jgi:PAS domain S-box-containing protein
MHEQSSVENNIREEKTSPDRAVDINVHEFVLDASGVAVVLTDTTATITGFNNAAEKMLGYSAAELVGKTTPIIFHDTDELVKRAETFARETGKSPEPAFDLMIAKAWHKRTTDSNDWTLVRKDGARFPARLTVIALRDKADEVKGFAGIIADLSENQRLKQQALLNEERFNLLAENIQGAIYLCHNDEQYSVIYINDHIRQITGYSKEDFMSRKITFASLFHPDDKKTIYETIDRSVAERKSFHVRYRLRHASGEWRWIEETGIGVYEGDKLMMLEGFLFDVTIQKDTEEKLRKVADENLRFFNNPVNLNAVVDFNANLIRISPSWTGMLGWTQEELLSKPLFHLIHPDDTDRSQEQLKSLSFQRAVHTFENRLACKDGSFRWLLWAVAPDPDAKIVYASAIDISERKRSEENMLDSKSNLEGITLQLQEQNRKLDEFAHIISHNLRAPVSNIQALINLLDERSEITDYKLIFDKLKNVAKNLSETMNELMDTLKAKTQPEVDLTEVRFKEVLDKVVQSLEGELIVAQASVTFDFNQAPLIRYSKPYLESIFQNLLTNAVKYKSPHRKPSIHLRSSMVDNHLELRVTDNGQGIDMEKFGDKLFGLHKTFHDHQEARGVGLFLVKTQIEALGGTIRVSSEVDKGTTFIIRFN